MYASRVVARVGLVTPARVVQTRMASQKAPPVKKVVKTAMKAVQEAALAQGKVAKAATEKKVARVMGKAKVVQKRVAKRVRAASAVAGEKVKAASANAARKAKAAARRTSALAAKKATALKKKAARTTKAQAAKAKLAKRKAAKAAAAMKKKAALAKRRESKQTKALQLKKAAAAKKAKAAEKKSAANSKKEALKAAGPVNPYSLFVSKNAKGKGKVNMKELAATWKGLSPAEKATYVQEAKKNLDARQKVRSSLKRPPSKYAVFVKQHFAAAYAAAMKTTTDRREAFKVASKQVSAKYKSSQ
ncbi:hypothetical protein DIPPA_15346 [Diplonema papillatum]|nr:hypothetical protein DIPPA_15346 [Diplonema papillatum]